MDLAEVPTSELFGELAARSEAMLCTIALKAEGGCTTKTFRHGHRHTLLGFAAAEHFHIATLLHREGTPDATD